MRGRGIIADLSGARAGASRFAAGWGARKRACHGAVGQAGPRVRGRRRGVTLLEVTLAMGLLVVLSSMTYWFYSSSLETRRRGTDEAYRLRLARVVLGRIANEIRQTSLITSDGRVGIRGEPDRVWLSTLRVPSRELARERLSREEPAPAEYDLVKVEYKIARHPDILHADGYEMPLGLARVELLRPRADSAQSGEAFEDERRVVGGDGDREEDRESGRSADEESVGEEVAGGGEDGQGEVLDEAALDEAFFGGEPDEEEEPSLVPEIAWEELYVPEFLFLRFCYYDGHTWWDSWELGGQNPLPQMVMITLGFEPHPPLDDEFVPEEIEEFCTCLNEDPVDCEPLPEDQYSMIVRVAQADPLFRSRIGRETQSLLERVTGEEP